MQHLPSFLDLWHTSNTPKRERSKARDMLLCLEVYYMGEKKKNVCTPTNMAAIMVSSFQSVVATMLDIQTLIQLFFPLFSDKEIHLPVQRQMNYVIAVVLIYTSVKRQVMVCVNRCPFILWCFERILLCVLFRSNYTTLSVGV
jgi:hypothetical protein